MKYNLNSELKKWGEKLYPKLTREQKRMYQDRPELLLEAVLDSYKQFCASQGIDYKTTAMYQAEQEYRHFQEQLQACRKKWAYLDTEQGIELYQMALHNVRERKMISLPNFYALWDYGCQKPSGFKAFMEMYVFSDEPSPELTPKKLNDYIRLYEYYEQFYSVEAFEHLSHKEQLLFYARHIAGRLTEEQKQFVSQFIDEYDALPLFYLITAFYKNTEYEFFRASRDYYGLCGGERKSLEQIQAEFGVSRRRAREIVGMWSPRGVFAIDIPPRFWDLYQEVFDDITLLTADNCHYEQIKKVEQLHMDVSDFMKIVTIRLPWIHWVSSVKRGDNRYWGVSSKLHYRFFFQKFFDDIRQEQIRKERPETVTFDLNKVCKNKKYHWDSNKPELTSEEAEMVISVIKPILKEMLGIETKGNKIIFPAKRKRNFNVSKGNHLNNLTI